MTFEKKGPQNTEQCIDLALQAAKERGIKDIVVASSTGATARRLKAYAGEYNIVCVALAYGTREPGSTPMAGETRAELEQAGIRVVFATHVFKRRRARPEPPVQGGISHRDYGRYPAYVRTRRQGRGRVRRYGRGRRAGALWGRCRVNRRQRRRRGQRHYPAARTRQQHSGNPNPRNCLQALEV